MQWSKISLHLYICVILLGQEARSQVQDRNSYIPLLKKSDWTAANAHSHNDYQQEYPFSSAYQAGFGSMEADIFLFHDSLYVGHIVHDTARHRTLRALYLDSIDYYIRKNDGFPYEEKSKRLQLLIDIKTDWESTLQALIKILEKYPQVVQAKQICLTITGNRPPETRWLKYPDYIYFDGEAGKTYPEELRSKIALLSANFAVSSPWNGTGPMDTVSMKTLSQLVVGAHQQGKKIRFWNAPDIPQGWTQLITLQMDWINTDHISALAIFLQSK